MESLQEFLEKKLTETYSLEDVREQILDIKRKLQDMETLVEDNPEFSYMDRAKRVIYKMLGDLESLNHMVPEPLMNEEAGIAIPIELQQSWLTVKKQIMDKQKKIGMITNEINILNKNLLGIENKAAQMQKSQPDQENQEAQEGEGKKTTIEVQGEVKESIDIDYWWKENVTESIDEEEPDIDLAADDVEDAVEAEDIVDAEEAIKDEEDSLDGDYVFTLKVIDRDEEEDIIVKFYQDEEDSYWKGRVVQGSEEPIESMQFDPDMEMIDIIEHLATMFEEVEQIDTDDYEEMLDDKEEIDSAYYDDIIEK